jgi:ribosomal protein L32E
MQLADFLTKEELDRVGPVLVAKIDEHIGKAIAEYEAKGNRQFNTLVEAVSGQFDALVKPAVQKKVDSMGENAVKGKLFEALQKIVNVLEECQIETTQEREAKKTVAQLKTELQEKVVEYKRAMKQLMYAKIADKVLRETNGYRPDLQQKAVEYFTNPNNGISLDDLKREDIFNYINGIEDDKITNSEFSGIGEIKAPNQVDMNELNEIADSLMNDDIAENGLANYRKNNLKVNEVRYPAGGNAAVGKRTRPAPKLASVGFGSKSAAFEALGQGLSQNKVYNSPDVTKEMLSQPTSLEPDVSDDDVRQAMSAMNVFI